MNSLLTEERKAQIVQQVSAENTSQLAQQRFIDGRRNKGAEPGDPESQTKEWSAVCSRETGDLEKKPELEILSRRGRCKKEQIPKTESIGLKTDEKTAEKHFLDYKISLGARIPESQRFRKPTKRFEPAVDRKRKRLKPFKMEKVKDTER